MEEGLSLQCISSYDATLNILCMWASKSAKKTILYLVFLFAVFISRNPPCQPGKKAFSVPG